HRPCGRTRHAGAAAGRGGGDSPTDQPPHRARGEPRRAGGGGGGARGAVVRGLARLRPGGRGVRVPGPVRPPLPRSPPGAAAGRPPPVPAPAKAAPAPRVTLAPAAKPPDEEPVAVRAEA